MGDAAEFSLYQIASPKILELILFPTEKCNFRCVYCYEDFRIGKMPQDVRAGIKALIARRCPDLSELRIAWFGGEPLMAKDVVVELSTFANDAADARGIPFLGSMVTNGYELDIDTLSELASCGVREYQITLDGPREIHDRLRVNPLGGQSFDRIFANLLSAKASDLDFRIKIRVHFSPDNYLSLRSFLPDLKETFQPGDDDRFQIYLHPVCNWGGPASGTLNVYKKHAAEDVFAELTALLGVPDPYADQSYVCYAAKANSFVIRSDGRIGKCTVALYDDRNTVGRIASDGSVDIDTGRLAPWLQGIKTLDPAYLACPYSNFEKPAH